MIAYFLLLLYIKVHAKYDAEIGYKGAIYSGVAYCNQSDIEQWSCKQACSYLPDITEVNSISAGSDYGYIAHNMRDNQIIIAFRGSSDIGNWVTNLQIEKTPYKNITQAYVHSGFNKAYNRLAGQLIMALQQYLDKYKSASILITGHSLGAALATLAAVDIRETANRPIHFYTYGSPRVGNREFSYHVMTLFPDSYNRIVHYNDAVPHVLSSIMGYMHAGNEIWYLNKGNDLSYKECQNQAFSSESQQCSNQRLIDTGIDAHLHYLGLPISRMCINQHITQA